MKTKYVAVFVILCSSFVIYQVTKSRSRSQAEDAKPVVSSPSNGALFVVVPENSAIHWVGSKPGGQHHGTINVASGGLVVKGTQILSGNFVIDMGSILDNDLTDTTMNAKLVGHLKSADFFDVAQFPNANFTITSATPASADSTSYTISGNLKLKGIEKNISFNAQVAVDGTSLHAVSLPFNIDRTQWGVNFGSKNIFKDLANKFIDDNIELTITLSAKLIQQ